jgi:hypothetical protein
VEFTIVQRIASPLDAVEAALLDPAFIRASAALPRLGGCELLDEQRNGEQVRLRVRRRFTGELNVAVTRVIDPAKLTWVEVIDYDRTMHAAQHRIVPDTYGDRFSARYSTLLTEGTGTQPTVRTARGSVRVQAPLVAGRVERAIVSGLEEYADAEADLLTSWEG